MQTKMLETDDRPSLRYINYFLYKETRSFEIDLENIINTQTPALNINANRDLGIDRSMVVTYSVETHVCTHCTKHFS